MSSPRLWTSFKFAFNGIYTLLKTQRNARIHLGFTVVVFFAGFYFSIGRTDWLILLLTIGGVWMAEAFNTALEILADTLHPQYHDGIGKAKDLAAAAVLLFAIAALVIGCLIFLPPLFAILKR